MKWASAASAEAGLERALDDTVESLRREMKTAEPDLVMVFVSAHHRDGYAEVGERLNREFDRSLIVGCSAGGVIGGGRELEREPGLSLTAAYLPGVRVRPVRLSDGDVPSLSASPREWEVLVGIEASESPHFVLLPDPFSFDPQPLLTGLDRAFPEAVKLGGLASGGRTPESNALYLGDEIYSSGLVGISLSGNVRVDTVVAQGCRPIGVPMFVTSADGGLVRTLDGRPPTEILAELYESADAQDRALFRHSLFVGLVMRSDQESYQRGDFLVRNIVGLEPRAGVLQVAAALHEGQVIQFHLRDAQTSAEDLTTLLTSYRIRSGGRAPAGALLFSCLGRGVHLYGEPDHDTNVFVDVVGESPLGGFFCNGEIGPVQGTTYLHGYTSSFGLFKPKYMH